MTLRFMEPRATPEARLALGAAFLRAARFTFFRSTLSVIALVFMILSSILRIFQPASWCRIWGAARSCRCGHSWPPGAPEPQQDARPEASADLAPLPDGEAHPRPGTRFRAR